MKRAHTIDDNQATTTSSVCAELPLDIWGEIFSYLHHEIRFFRCATVCTRWYQHDFLYKSAKWMRPSEMLRIDDTKLAKMNNLASLFIVGWHMNHVITNSGVSSLTNNLTRLEMIGPTKVDDDGIKQLTSLITLKIASLFVSIGDEAITRLTKLETLWFVSANHTISENGLVGLTNLTSLSLPRDCRITNECMNRLCRLKALNLASNDTITDEGLGELTQLESLGLSGLVSRIKGTVFPKLAPTLTSLVIDRENYRVKDKNLMHLTGLRRLHLQENKTISDAALSKLTNLVSLFMNGHTGGVSSRGISCLTNLTTLWIGSNKLVTPLALKPLSKLKELHVVFTMVESFRNDLPNLGTIVEYVDRRPASSGSGWYDTDYAYTFY